MKKISLAIIIALSFLMSGCGSSQPSVPKVQTSEKFKVGGIKFYLSEKVKSDIKYHTQEEFTTMLTDSISSSLEEKGYLSTSPDMNEINIKVNYQRKYVGEDTPFPSDSLAYPVFSYNITVLDGTKELTEINKNDMQYRGSFTMNLKVMAAQLKEKKYEIDFIKALSNSIAKDIINLKS
ncbi:MAG: hypothetical protein OQK11_08725 [Thiovulaceae bacterium]|nr:hypothetical protein [Sulfurimonadaceae bacterium]